MTTTRYRVVYRNGSHGAWTSNKEWIEYLVKKFNAKMETWVVDLP